MQTESAEGAIVSVTSGEAVSVIKSLPTTRLIPRKEPKSRKVIKRLKLNKRICSEEPVPVKTRYLAFPLPMKFWVRLCFAGISRHTPMRVYSSVNLYLLSAFHRSAS